MSNLEELEQKYTELGKEIERLKNKQSGKRWRSKPDKMYYYLDDSGVVGYVKNWPAKKDDFRWETGNYFETEKEVFLKKKKDLARQKIIDFIAEGNAKIGWVADWDNFNQDKYCAYYDHNLEKIHFASIGVIAYLSTEFFGAQKVIKQAIIELEEEYKLFFGVSDERV